MNNDNLNNKPINSVKDIDTNAALETLMKEHNIDVNTISEGAKTIKKETKSLLVFFKDFYKYITTHKISELFELLIYAIIIMAFIVLLSIPFAFIKEMFNDILVMFGINFNQTLKDLLNNVWDMFYLLVALFLFLILCKEKFYQMIANKKEIEDLKQEINK